MSQTIESYLVSLGFDVKTPELQKFNTALDNVGKTVEKNTSGVIGNLFKMQFALTSAFLAVGAGVVGMIDKVAMADQSYRLMGLQMFMSKNAAQSMDIALKALGATIDQVAWDPELHERYVQLQKDQRMMIAGLGGDFEAHMRQIRDIRFEWSRFTVELQYLSMGVVNDLFNKLGLGSGTIVDKLKSFNDYIIAHIPEISAAINEVLVPAFKGAWEILKDFGEIGKEAWITFQQIVGILSGDSSLDGTAVSLESVSRTLQHVTEDAHLFLQAMLSAEKVVAHFALALADIGTGHFAEAANQIKEAFQSFTPGGGAILGTVGGSALGGVVGASVGGALGIEAGPLGVMAGSTAGATAGSWLGGGIGALSGWLAGKANPLAGVPSSVPVSMPSAFMSDPHDRLRANAAEIARQTGADPSLVFAQLWHETAGGTNRGARELHNLGGIEDGHGKYKAFASDFDFDKDMARILTRDGVAAATNVREYASDLKKAGYYGDSLANYTRGMTAAQGQYSVPGASITKGDTYITVQVATNANPDQIAKAIAAKQQQQNLIGMANVTGVHQ